MTSKRVRKKTKAPPPKNGGGDLVRAVVVARLLGFDARTVRRYVRRKVWGGKIVGKRVFVFRSVVDSLRDPGAPDVAVV